VSRVIHSKYALLDIVADKLREAVVFEGIAERNLLHTEREWRRSFKERLKRARKKKKIGWHDEDYFWDWRSKQPSEEAVLDLPSFALEIDGLTEGLLWLNLGIEYRSHSGGGMKKLVYVDFVAAAPWNRPQPDDTPKKFYGVGLALIDVAVAVSYAEGCDGRIGLHSLPRAEEFYEKKCQMQDFGPDAKHRNKLRYYEMSDAQAKAFRAQITSGMRI
jgi:hypothetical protein